MTAYPELGEFLRSRRGRLRPGAQGLPSYGARRVPGLRREELAQLAGISPTYYTRLEQGQSHQASDGVLDSLAAALQLSPDERRHLRALAHASRTPPVPADEPLRPETRMLVETVGEVPVVALDRRNDVLAWNGLGHALLAGHLDRDAPRNAGDRPNLLRMLFLDPHTRELYRDRSGETERAVGSLRRVAAGFPDDPALTALIGELCVHSAEFAALWSAHPVAACSHGTKRFHHPTVGDLDLAFTMLSPDDATGHRLLTLTAEPSSPAGDALRLLRRGTAG